MRIMKKFLMFLAMLLISYQAHAGTVTVPTTWANGDSVTATKLNNINSTFANTLNGGLDNNNADTTNGYFFFKRVGSLPAAGNQGSVYFLTSDNTLNLDTGSTFTTASTIGGAHAQGDVIYYNGSGFTGLAAGTSGYYLKTLGAGANPVWADALTGHMLYADTRYKVGTFNRTLNTASGDVAYTGIGFTPKAILFFGGVSNDYVTTQNGFDDGTTHYCLANYGASGAGFNNWVSGSSIALFRSTITFQKALVKTFDADGFTLTWTLTGAGSVDVANMSYIAFR